MDHPGEPHEPALTGSPTRRGCAATVAARAPTGEPLLAETEQSTADTRGTDPATLTAEQAAAGDGTELIRGQLVEIDRLRRLRHAGR